MTRSSDEALDEAQLALGTKCERLLSSKAWHKAHTTTEVAAGVRAVIQHTDAAVRCRYWATPATVH